MARIQFEFHARSGASIENDVAATIAAQVEALHDACIAAGLDVRGHGVDVTLDPPPAVVESPPAVEPAP